MFGPVNRTATRCVMSCPACMLNNRYTGTEYIPLHCVFVQHVQFAFCGSIGFLALQGYPLIISYRNVRSTVLQHGTAKHAEIAEVESPALVA